MTGEAKRYTADEYLEVAIDWEADFDSCKFSKMLRQAARTESNVQALVEFMERIRDVAKATDNEVFYNIAGAALSNLAAKERGV